MIYITGDTHSEFYRFTSKRFPEQKGLGREDYVIICGDFGGLWDGSAEENYWLGWLNDKPFTTLWVDGNHENFDMLEAIPAEPWHGGMVQRVRPNILHLMRGQLYDIGGRTFFTMGGASSHDISDGILDPKAPDYSERLKRLTAARRALFRVLGRSWWPQELPSDIEYQTALDTLDRAGWRVDYVISHCAPSRVAKMVSPHFEADRLTDFFGQISQRLDYRTWFFGHYHNDQLIGEKYVLLYNQILEIT